MALPVTISAVLFPDGNYHCGPFRSSAGNFYTILLDSTDASIIEVHRAADPTISFSESDSPGKPNLTNNVVSMWVHQESDVLHIAHQETITGRVGYSTFDMAGNGDLGLWGTVNLLVEAVANVPGVDAIGCSISVRSDGDVIVLYNGNTDTVMGQQRNRVDHARKENGTFATVGVEVSDSPSNTDHQWHGSVIVRGSSDRMHFLFQNVSLRDVFQRTLTGANVLETFPAAGDSSVSATGHVFGPGISYDDGGTQRIRAPYRDRFDLDRQISYAEFDSVDAPGAFAVNFHVGDNNVSEQFFTPVVCLAVDGADEHLLYSGGGVGGADQDLFHDTNDGVDVEELDGVTVNRVSCNVYDRSGTKLAYVYDDAGTIKYNEVALAAPPAGGASKLADVTAIAKVSDVV